MNSKRTAVSNSGPLIHLAKAQLLDYLFMLYDIIFIPETVFQEVIIKGKKNGHADAFLIEEKIKNSQIVVKNVNFDRISPRTTKLHRGELEAILLAINSKNKIILLDDEEARIFARIMKLKVKGTLGLLKDFVKHKLLEIKEALKFLNRLNEIMYLSADIYNFMVKELNK